MRNISIFNSKLYNLILKITWNSFAISSMLFSFNLDIFSFSLLPQISV